MLEDYWHIVCASNKLRTKPMAVTLFAKHVVLGRDEEGKAFALEDRCAHRNMPLSCGKIAKGQIQCPYHGWQHDATGQVSLIPSIPSSKQNTGRFKINAYPCYEQQGYIWVCLSGRPIQQSPPEFPYMGTQGWHTFRMKTRFKTTPENCLENFLDVPHATFVHKRWFRSPHAKTIQAKVTTLEDGAMGEYLQEPRKKSWVFGLLSSHKSQLTHTDRFIAPSMSRVDYQFSDQRHYIISSFCSPVNEQETEVFTVISYRYAYLGWLIRLVFEPLSRLIIKQDVKTLNQQQANTARFGEEKFAQIPQDLLRPHIVRWRRAIQAGQTPEYKPQNKQVDLSV